MLRLPKELKLQLFNLLKSQSNPFGDLSGTGDIIPFLETIWPLRTMPSEDPRFNDAYADAVQHLLNNSDWDIDYIFLTRFKLLDDDEKYSAFLDAIVSPAVRQNEDEIIKYILLIEPFIAKYEYIFAVENHTEANLPVYKLKENVEGADFLFDLKPNSIPIYADFDKIGRSNTISGHRNPPVIPSLILVFNDGWNDYSIMSTFNLFYHGAANLTTHIGEVKIISNSSHLSIQEDLPPNFTQLDTTFCSLGQEASYYQNLKLVLSSDYQSVLYALRDASLFPDNHDRFEKNKKFINSLIRYDSAEKLLRTARYLSYDYGLSNLYSFRYSFKPKYAEEAIPINFEFSDQNFPGNRIYAIIGKNGTGKTQLITSLPLDISRKVDSSFVPRPPLFSKVIAVSYSFFDKFDIPKKSSSFNYVYCGLRKDEQEKIPEKGLVMRFYNSWKRIQTQGRLETWKRILSNFVTVEVIESFIIAGDTTNNEQEFKIDTAKFQQARKGFSSGQSIVFYIISEIIANIRLDSLLLYDEPETHLHPNAISELIYVIYELVNEFQSYCIIATHSPVIVRELFSKNVYVLERVGDVPSIRSIGIESFGEDIGVLTDEVFGNKEVPKQYKRIIDNLVRLGNSFEQIIEVLETDNVPLSLNTRLYIKSSVKINNA